MNVIGVSSSAASASALARAASSGLISECRRLLALGADPLFAESRPLRLAAGHGRLDCVALLIPVSDLRTFTVSPLFHAAMAGEVECIRALLPGSPPLDDFPAPLKAASWHGHAKAVALMLEYAPEAASCLDLPSLELDAINNGHYAVAEFWASFRERRELASGVSVSSLESKTNKPIRL